VRTWVPGEEPDRAGRLEADCRFHPPLIGADRRSLKPTHDRLAGTSTRRLSLTNEWPTVAWTSPTYILGGSPRQPIAPIAGSSVVGSWSAMADHKSPGNQPGGDATKPHQARARMAAEEVVSAMIDQFDSGLRGEGAGRAGAVELERCSRSPRSRHRPKDTGRTSSSGRPTSTMHFVSGTVSRGYMATSITSTVRGRSGRRRSVGSRPWR